VRTIFEERFEAWWSRVAAVSSPVSLYDPVEQQSQHAPDPGLEKAWAFLKRSAATLSQDRNDKQIQ
jgi:hypothetical protein